ncbi:homeobox protein aristaless [Apis mellifera carnica]|nr:homeobox protein aristaless [Apis mellifera carnica]
MDLSTTPRRITEGVADLQKTRVAKSVFSIRSLVDVGDTDLSEVEDNEKIQSEFLPFHATVTIINLFFFFPLPLPLRNVPRKAC